MPQSGPTPAPPGAKPTLTSADPAATRSATSGANVYLGGQFIELGVVANGGFGPSGAKPAGFFGTPGDGGLPAPGQTRYENAITGGLVSDRWDGLVSALGAQRFAARYCDISMPSRASRSRMQR